VLPIFLLGSKVLPNVTSSPPSPPPSLTPAPLHAAAVLGTVNSVWFARWKSTSHQVRRCKKAPYARCCKMNTERNKHKTRHECTWKQQRQGGRRRAQRDTDNMGKMKRCSLVGRVVGGSHLEVFINFSYLLWTYLKIHEPQGAAAATAGYVVYNNVANSLWKWTLPTSGASPIGLKHLIVCVVSRRIRLTLK